MAGDKNTHQTEGYLGHLGHLGHLGQHLRQLGLLGQYGEKFTPQVCPYEIHPYTRYLPKVLFASNSSPGVDSPS